MFRTFVALTVSAMLLSGCAGVVDSIKSAFDEQPSAAIKDVRVSGFDLQSVTLDFDVEIINPYSVGLPLASLDYALSTNAQPFLDGSSKLEGSVPAEGMRTVTLPLRVELAGLLDTVKDLRPGQVIPYDAQLGLNVDVPGAGPVGLPLSKSGELPIPAPPRVSVASLDWESVSLTEVSGMLQLNVTNPNEFAFTLKSLDYDLSLADHQVASGESTKSLWLSEGHESRLGIPLSFSPGNAGTALLGMFGDGLVDYAITGNMAIETAYGLISIPFEQSGKADQNR